MWIATEEGDFLNLDQVLRLEIYPSGDLAGIAAYGPHDVGFEDATIVTSPDDPKKVKRAMARLYAIMNGTPKVAIVNINELMLDPVKLEGPPQKRVRS